MPAPDKSSGFDQALAQLEEANERVNKRAGRDLAAAIVVGLTLGAGVIVTLCLVDKNWFMLFGGYFLLGASTVELARAFRRKNFRIPVIPIAITVLVTIPVAYYFGPLWGWISVLGGMGLTALVQSVASLVPSRTRSNSSDAPAQSPLRGSIVAGMFTLAYPLGLGLFSISLVALPDGQWWALSMLILATSVDVGAFASGVLFGKHPMAPRISPKKTWEGFAGALLAVIIAGALLAILTIHESIVAGIVLGLVVLVTATLGDLFESQLKRWIGVKDMSSWLAGHGGFLDRLDSVLPSGVVVFVVYHIVTALG